jgi:hypothetical protein
MKLVRTLCLTGLLFCAAKAEAYPLLQLDIIGGSYDPVTQTIVSSGPDLTLIALLTPRPNDNLASLLGDTYYISAALNPQTGPTGSALGSFTWNGTNYNATENMQYGRPPLEASGAGGDAGDLSPHSVFPTYFQEFGFQFTNAQRAVSYDSAETPGGLVTTTDTSRVSYYALFNITTSLVGSNVLHFDLYDTLIRNCSQSGCTPDEDVDGFAPFSHDAQTRSVPEPETLGFLATGAIVAVLMLRRMA